MPGGLEAPSFHIQRIQQREFLDIEESAHRDSIFRRDRKDSLWKT